MISKLINRLGVVAGAFMALLITIPSSVFAKTDTLALLVAFKPAAYEQDYLVVTTSKQTDEVGVRESRIKRLDDFFAKRNMPLAGYGSEFIAATDKCDIDWRLLPAISVRESSGGKHMIRNNPFGWGSAKIRFESIEDAIEGVSDNLCGLNPSTAKYYNDKTTYERLWYYNGTVIKSYPKEVMDIMDMM